MRKVAGCRARVCRCNSSGIRWDAVSSLARSSSWREISRRPDLFSAARHGAAADNDVILHSRNDKILKRNFIVGELAANLEGVKSFSFPARRGRPADLTRSGGPGCWIPADSNTANT